MSKSKTQQIAFAAIIAAVYAALTLALIPTSYGVMQLRISEALTVLPYFTPFAIPGLFIGCFLSNILSPVGGVDLIVGSLATLAAAVMTYYIGKSNLKHKKLLAPLPPVIVNAIIIGIMLNVLYVPDIPVYLCMLQVGLGQVFCCYVLGLPLMSVIERNPALARYFRYNK